jgi:hypothetical protein
VLSTARAHYKEKRDRGESDVTGGVGEDFSKEVREQRQKLLPFLKIQREKNPTLSVYLRFNRLVVGRKPFILNDSGNGIVPLYST